MKVTDDRIPKVIPVDFSDDDEDDHFIKYSAIPAADKRSQIMQHTEGAQSPAASSMASDSDYNALFDSDQEQYDQYLEVDAEQTAAVEDEQPAVVQPPSPSPYTTRDSNDHGADFGQLNTAARSAEAPAQANCPIEKFLESLIKKATDVDNWATKHGYAYYMSERFHCNFQQGQNCVASFDTNDGLVEHLGSAHNLSYDTTVKALQQKAQDKELARWIVQSTLPMHVVTDGRLSVYLGTLQGKSNKEKGTGNYVSQSRLEQVIKAEHKAICSELSERLTALEHISIAANLWERPGHSSILLLSVFFMDQTWHRQSYLIAAEPLEGVDIRNALSEKMGYALLQLNILEKVYSITCQGIHHLDTSALFAHLQSLSRDRSLKLTKDRIYTITLDQLVTRMRIELLSSLQFDCEPLKTIRHEAQNCKCNIFQKEMHSHSIKLMRVYLDNKKNHHIDCQMNLSTICEADDECMAQIIRMDQDLAFIDAWLYNAAEMKSMIIANKAYVICCELGKAIKALAELRSSRRLAAKSLTSKNYEIAEAVKKADYMKKPLEVMHRLLSAYRTQIENGRGHVEAFVYDAYAYNDAYFRPPSATSFLLSTHQLYAIHLLLEDYAEQDSKHYRINDITELLNINVEERQQSDKRLQSAKSGSAVPATSSLLTHIFSEEVRLLEQRLSAYLAKHPPPRAKDGIAEIMSEPAVRGQCNYWQQESEDKLLVLMNHTKKAFSIPTTSHECTNAVDAFKAIYLQLIDDEKDVNAQFACERSLVSCWGKEFSLFKN